MGSDIFLLDRTGGLSQTIAATSFAQLEVKEVKDLERWIADNPDILGTRLLIITTEYDRFEKSEKRLDLLAIDEEGKLTIIELKRDAAGTLADLQAIRYAAFCSTMTFEQIVGLRAEHANTDTENARREIREFVGDPSFSELDDQPRIILAAGGFDDQELTSCVLWLRRFDVDISCVEITPYQVGSDLKLILVPRVIIPLPQTLDFMVGTERKEIEKARTSASEQIFKERNRQILAYFAGLAPGKGPKEPASRSFMGIASGHSGVRFEWAQRGKSEKTIEVAIQFQTPEKKRNQELFDFFSEHRGKLAAQLGEASLKWDRRNWGEKWASIYLQRAAEPWSEEVVRWAAEKMITLIAVAQPLIDQFYEERRTANTDG